MYLLLYIIYYISYIMYYIISYHFISYHIILYCIIYIPVKLLWSMDANFYVTYLYSCDPIYYKTVLVLVIS